MIPKKTILVINNAEKGISEFYEPFEKILIKAGVGYRISEYSEIPDLNNGVADGIILTGSPCGDDIVDHHLPYFRWIKSCNIPILGICAGHHIIGALYGSELLRSREIEIGDFPIILDRPTDPLFKGCSMQPMVRQNHKDSITLPEGFILLAHSEICKVSAMRHPKKLIYSTQFHPEFLNQDILINFVNLCK